MKKYFLPSVQNRPRKTLPCVEQAKGGELDEKNSIRGASSP